MSRTPGGTDQDPSRLDQAPKGQTRPTAPPTKTEQKEQENNTMIATQTATIGASEIRPTTATAPRRVFNSDKISPRTLEILHKAIDRGTRAAAGWTGTPLYELVATADPETPRGKAILAAYSEASKRAYSALSSWHRYAMVEASGETASIRTPAQLDPQTGAWGGIFYGLNIETGFCSCPDHAGHLPRINGKLMEYAPEAAPVVCKHFVILAIMAANRELTLPERAITTPTAPVDTELWEIWYHNGDPAKARIFAHSLTRTKAETEASEAASFYSAPSNAAKYPLIRFEIRPAAPAPAAPANTTKTHKGDF